MPAARALRSGPLWPRWRCSKTKSRLSTPPPTAAAARARRAGHSLPGARALSNGGGGGGTRRRPPYLPRIPDVCRIGAYDIEIERYTAGRCTAAGGVAGRGGWPDRAATRGPRGPVPYTSTRYRPYSDRTTLLMVPGPAELRAEAALKAAARRRNRRPKPTRVALLGADGRRRRGKCGPRSRSPRWSLRIPKGAGGSTRATAGSSSWSAGRCEAGDTCPAARGRAHLCGRW